MFYLESSYTGKAFVLQMVAIFFCSGLSTTLLLMNLIKSFQSAEVRIIFPRGFLSGEDLLFYVIISSGVHFNIMLNLF